MPDSVTSNNESVVLESVIAFSPMVSSPQSDDVFAAQPDDPPVVVAVESDEEIRARRIRERNARQREIDNQMVVCVRCDEEMRRGDGWYAEWDNDWYCEPCYYDREGEIQEMEEEERRHDLGEHIHYYSYRPEIIFRDVDWDNTGSPSPVGSRRGQTGRLYMGFELEVECEDSRGRIADAFHHSANKWRPTADGRREYAELVYLKEDGSLSNGFEIVTHPCSLDFYQEFFPWASVEALREQGVTAWNSRSCGLHIHMNRDSFVDERHLWKFIVFVYKNPTEMIRFAGRNSSYAKFERSNLLSFYDYEQNRFSSATYMSHAKGKTKNDDRYTAVNLQPVHTVEMRFFRPSLRTNTVRAALELCAAVHEYTNTLSTKDVLGGALKWPRFRAWVAGQAKYRVLDNRIAERFDEVVEDQ